MTTADLSAFRPATDLLIESLRETVAQVQAHAHPTSGGVLYCLNLVSFMGDRMGPVLCRLADEQAKTRQWRERNSALADQALADVDAFQPAVTGGYQLYVHGCGNVEQWNEANDGPIRDQGCDACESAPDGTWRLLYVRDEAPR